MLRPLLGVLAAAAAWWFLVRAAVLFGRSAVQDGAVAGWAFTGLASVGAALCLMLVFLLLARIWEKRTPRGPAGGRRRR